MQSLTNRLLRTQATHRPMSVRVQASAKASKVASRHTGAFPRTGMIYTRPDLANLLDLDLSEAVKIYSQTTQDPVMYSHKLDQQKKLQQEGASGAEERVNWSEIL